MSDDETNAGEAESTGTTSTKAGDDDGSTAKTSAPRQLSISVRSAVIGIVIAGLLAAVGVMTWLYIGAQNELDNQARRSEERARAEKTAIDYAVNAAAMNYKDLSGWKEKLVAGTTPELKDKLSEAATSMEQILVPLQWDSTAQPLAAKVRSETAGVYTVDSFVGVLTKTVQAPEGLQSTATYTVTIDSNNNWQISDVGGIGDVVPPK